MTPNEAYLQEQLDHMSVTLERAAEAIRAGEVTNLTLAAYSATQEAVIKLFSLQVQALMAAVVDYQEQYGETAAARQAVTTVANIKHQMEARLAAGRNEVARIRSVAHEQQS